jgi:outer membrane biosynthesis protein TonB
MPADQPRVDVRALRTGDADGSAPSASAAAPVADLEKAATSSIRAARAASNPAASQRQVTTVQTPPPTPPAATSAPVEAPPTAQPSEQPKPAPRRVHRAPARPRQEPATTEATASTPRNEATKTEHSSKSSTPAKTGDVPLF